MIKLAIKHTSRYHTFPVLYLYIFINYSLPLFSDRKECFFMISCGLLLNQASNIF